MAVVWDDERKKPSGVVWDDEKPATAEKMDPVMAGMAAAGRVFDRTASGLRDLTPGPVRRGLDYVNDRLGMGKPPTIDPAEIARNDTEFGKLQKEQPIATFVGDLAPRMLTANPLSMAAMAGLEYGTLGERITHAGLAYGGGKLGQYVGGKLADAAERRLASRPPPQPMPARDETIKEMMDAGLKIPPDQVNPSPLNRLLTGLAGKANTQQGMAMANEPKLVSIAKQELSIPDHIPLNEKTIKTVRDTAGLAYDQAKKFGTFTADSDFVAAREGLTAEYRALVAEYPPMRNREIDVLSKMVDRPEFKSAPTVELVKRLRKDSRTNFKAFDAPEKQALAKVQIGIADELENLMDRNFVASGNEGFMEVFRKARTLIAKTHTVEDALEESTGKIVASKIKGGHLTGGLATIAKAHEAFPKSVQNINTPMPGMSPLDFMAGLIGGQAGGFGTGMGIPLVRPLVRGAITSDIYQKGLLKAGGKEPDLFELLKNKEATKRLGGLLGPSGLEAYQ